MLTLAICAIALYVNRTAQHGDNGAGMGAGHQTGWTGAITRVMHMFATLTPKTVLAGNQRAFFENESQAAKLKPVGYRK